MHVPPPPPPASTNPSKIPTWAWLVAGAALLLICVGFFSAMAQSLSQVNDIVKDLGGPVEPSAEEATKDSAPEYAASYAVLSIDYFVADVGRWPTKEEGLDALLKAPAGVAKWNGPYAYDYFKDEWGNRVVYEPLPDGYRVTSLGEDGKPGGAGTDGDLIVERRSK